MFSVHFIIEYIPTRRSVVAALSWGGITALSWGLLAGNGAQLGCSHFYTSLNIANYIISSVVFLENNGEERGCPQLEIQFVSHGVQTKWILLHALMLNGLDFHQNKLDHCFFNRKFNISYLKFI